MPVKVLLSFRSQCQHHHLIVSIVSALQCQFRFTQSQCRAAPSLSQCQSRFSLSIGIILSQWRKIIVQTKVRKRNTLLYMYWNKPHFCLSASPFSISVQNSSLSKLLISISSLSHSSPHSLVSVPAVRSSQSFSSNEQSKHATSDQTQRETGSNSLVMFYARTEGAFESH